MSSVLTARSRLMLVFAVALPIAALFVTRSVTGQETAAAAAVANAPAVVFSVASTAFIFWAALRFSASEPVRKPWIAIGLAIAATATAEVLWAYYEVILHTEVPYPGVPDLFYLACYPLFAAGILTAVRSFKGLVPIGRAVAISAVACALASAWLYFAVLRLILSDPEITGPTKFVSLFYPLGDVWLMVFPSLVLAIMLSSLAGGRISWPWWAVVAGSMSIAIADVLFTVADWNGTYSTGSPLDAGWWIGYLLLAAGASVFVDIQKPVTVRSERSSRARAAGEVAAR